MLWRSSLFCGLGCKGERQLQSRDVSLCSAGKVTAYRKRAGTLRWARGREGCSDSADL